MEKPLAYEPNPYNNHAMLLQSAHREYTLNTGLKVLINGTEKKGKTFN